MLLRYFFLAALVLALLSQEITLVHAAGGPDSLGRCQKSGCRIAPTPDAKPVNKHPVYSTNELRRVKSHYDFPVPSSGSAASPEAVGLPKNRLPFLLIEWITVFFFLRLLLYMRHHGLNPLRRRLHYAKSSIAKVFGHVYSWIQYQVSLMRSRNVRVRLGLRRAFKERESMGSLSDLIGWDDEEKSTATEGDRGDVISSASNSVASSSAYSSSYYSDSESDLSTSMRKGYPQGSYYSESESDLSTAVRKGNQQGFVSEDESLSSMLSNDAVALSESPPIKFRRDNSKLPTHFETDTNSSSSTTRHSMTYSSSSGSVLTKFMEYLTLRSRGTSKDDRKKPKRRKSSLDENSLRNLLERPLSYESQRTRRSTITGDEPSSVGSGLTSHKGNSDYFSVASGSKTSSFVKSSASTLQHQNVPLNIPSSSDTATSSVASSFIKAPMQTQYIHGDGMKPRYADVGQTSNSGNQEQRAHPHVLYQEQTNNGSTVSTTQLQTILSESISKMQHTSYLESELQGRDVSRDTQSLLELLLDRNKPTVLREISSPSISVADSLSEVNLRSVASYVV